VSLPVEINPHLLGSSAGGYEIERSLRFNSADSAYLNRTPASAGNRKTWTWSCWIKGSAATSSMFSASDGSAGALYTRFGGNGAGIDIGQFNTVADFSLYTNAVTRDYSAWYHIVIAVDTTQATSTNRVKIYINSVEQTSLVGTYPTLNQDTFINSTNAHAVGRFENVGQYLNGYLTEVNFIDGQALTPSSFGETDSATGVWKPKAYTGTYGTNGFFLKFADNSGTTSTTLGKDSSGNGNNWTPNNFSIATISSKTFTIDGTGTSENGGFRYSLKVSGAGTVNLTANGGGGNLAGPTFTGISTINGNLNDWGNSIVRKNGTYLFAVAGGRVTNDSGSQTATQARSANSVTQTAVSVADGDILSIDFGVNSTVTVYYGYPNAPSFSVTAANGASLIDVTNDSMVDSPTAYGTDTGVGGEVRGNYATLNPLSSIGTLTDGNLDGTTGSGGSTLSSTIGVKTGKWYFEAVMTAKTSTGAFVGIVSSETLTPSGAMFEDGNFGYGYYSDTGNIYYGSSASNIAYGASWAVNDVIGCAFDADAGTLVFYKNGVSQGTYSSVTTGYTYLFGVCEGQGSATATFTVNFGQRPFAYTAPSGFQALCTTNLPTPTIGATSTTLAGKYFNTVLYTGNGAAQSITGVGFQPDFVWVKRRDAIENHNLFDSVRGIEKRLFSNLTNAENTSSGTLTSFDSDGWSTTGFSDLNANSGTFVNWNWNAGGSTVTNTSGTISAQVKANPTSGFSIVTYTGTGANATVGHGLGVAPSMVIVKKRSAIENWVVYHTSVGATKYLALNLTNAEATSATRWNDTAPTSTVFSIGTSGNVNDNTGTYVAYCFAPVAGYSAFGKYTGNGSADGPFVYTGFRPRFVLMKYTNTTSYWIIFDTVRSTYNLVTAGLRPNDSAIENTNLFFIDSLSNGFKVRDSGGLNGSGDTTIYAAFAENPFKYALAR
jgi:hypothetical protein